jgi:hypothetical protein
MSQRRPPVTETTVVVTLPSETVEQLERFARQQQRSVSELVRDLVVQEVPGLLLLPHNVEQELAAFDYLSDDSLWLLAQTVITPQQQQELAALNEVAQQRPLTEEEANRQQVLVDAYDRALVRRAQAVSTLKARGHELTPLLNIQSR